VLLLFGKNGSSLRNALDIETLAWTYVRVGEYDAAIEQLEHLLSIPSEVSSHLLRLDPIYDPLRDHPRFEALLQKTPILMMMATRFRIQYRLTNLAVHIL